jgi:hypothetical protein
MIGHQERFAQIGQVLTQLREMDALLCAVALVAIGDMAPYWHRPIEAVQVGGPQRILNK